MSLSKSRRTYNYEKGGTALSSYSNDIAATFMQLFGADGIRGQVDRRPLRHDDVERIGWAICVWSRQNLGDTSSPTFLVGTDTRESSQRLKHAFITGIAQGGGRVIDGGVLPTAAISFLLASKQTFAGGIVISASHNGIEENGIKLFDAQGVKFTQQDESLIEALFRTDNRPFWERTRSSEPHRTESGYVNVYVSALIEDFRDRDWTTRRVVVDCANGAAYSVVPLVLRSLGIPHVLLHATPNGVNTNRNCGSEYARRNPAWLAGEVVKHDALLGIALDGDADRVVFVDRDGVFFEGDKTLAVFAEKLKREKQLRKNTVVMTHMSNTGLIDYLAGRDIQSHVVRNGDRFVTEALLKNGFVLGGEHIGHIVIKTDSTRITGDGLRTALLMLAEMIDLHANRLTDLVPRMRMYPYTMATAQLNRRTSLQPADIPGLTDLIALTRVQVPDLVRLECRPASTESAYRIILEAHQTNYETLMHKARALAEFAQTFLGCKGYPIYVA